MRRIAFTFLALVMLFTAVFPCAAFAEAPDFSAATVDEILEVLNAIRNELVSRDLVQREDVVLIDENDVKLYLTGKYEIEEYSSGTVYIELEAVVVNNTDKKIGVRPDSSSVNGWDVDYSGISDVSAGKKKKGEIELKISDADISTFEEIEDVELTMLVYDGENYQTIFITQPITFFMNDLPDPTKSEPAQEHVAVSEVEFNETRYITLQGAWIDEGTTQESLDAEAGNDYISAVLNDDGSVTYEMNSQQYIDLLGNIMEVFSQLEWMGIEMDESVG